MKHFFIILFVLLSMNVFAQNWAPFPLDETSEWHVVTSQLYSDFCASVIVKDYYISDTVSQNGNEYYQIDYSATAWIEPLAPGNPALPCYYNTVPISYSDSAGLVRSEEGITFLATEDGEELLYDFTLEVGDTGIWRGGFPTYVVDSTDQVTVGNNTCKRLWVYVPGTIINPVWIIEGVGHQHGLFELMFEFENTGDICYKENGVPVVYYDRFGEAGVCYVTSVGERSNQCQIDVFPNPSKGIFKLDLQQQYGYQVFDLFGKLVLEGSSSGQTSIDLNSESNGIYILRVESEQGSFTQKLVKQ